MIYIAPYGRNFGGTSRTFARKTAVSQDVHCGANMWSLARWRSASTILMINTHDFLLLGGNHLESRADEPHHKHWSRKSRAFRFYSCNCYGPSVRRCVRGNIQVGSSKESYIASIQDSLAPAWLSLVVYRPTLCTQLRSSTTA